MPTKRKIVQLPIKGGWAPALGPQAQEVSHLLRAENVYYELGTNGSGGFRKIPGALPLNATPLTESGSAVSIMALFDYWKSGSVGLSAQTRMCYAGTQIYKEDVDGVWDSITTGLESGKRATFMQANDLCVWASTSNVDVPQKWDQIAATTSNLGGSPPNFAFCVKHRGRGWAAGVASNPSRVYYTALDNIEDWTGAGSGSIDIEINDGDEVTGLASHKQRLWIFKGPNRGSIHYITGSAPTGSDAFARVPFNTGVPLVAHQTIIAFPGDLAFLSTRGVHSLATTEQYGDMADSFLSFPLAHGTPQFWPDDISMTGLPFAQGVHHASRGVLLWSLRQNGQTQNNYILAYDYRFTPGRFSLLTAHRAASIAIMQHLSRPRLFAGGYDGYVLRHDEANRNINTTTAYTARVQLPFLHYGQPDLLKQTAWLRLGLLPRGGTAITIRSANDEEAQVSGTVLQTSGSAFDSAVWDTDVFGGSQYAQRYYSIPGSYRTQQLEFVQGGLNADMEIHELAVQLEGAGLSEV